MKANEFLGIYVKMLSAYSDAVTKACRKYGVNRTCFDILIFLKNNPEDNTARDIVEKRGIKKSMASVAVEQLCMMDYVTRYQDQADRRIQHLKLTRKSESITCMGLKLQAAFEKRVLNGMNAEERKTYLSATEKLLAALKSMKAEEFI